MSNIIIDSFRFGASSPVAPSLGYGLLYNWYAATDVRGVAPSGFRVPSSSDYTTLLATFANPSAAGISLRSDRTNPEGEPEWVAGNDGTNDSGFTAFPAGNRDEVGSYAGIGTRLEAYCTDVIGPPLPRILLIIKGAGDMTIISNVNNKAEGLSIRCVSDTEPLTTLVQDADGNNYSWVLIGAQYWLVQSLRTTKYNNGDSIVTGLDDTAWAATTDGAWAYPNGDSSLPI